MPDLPNYVILITTIFTYSYIAIQFHCNKYSILYNIVYMCKFKHTVNVERFAGLNFYIFRSFQEYHKSFSTNGYKLHIMTLFKSFKGKVL